MLIDFYLIREATIIITVLALIVLASTNRHLQPQDKLLKVLRKAAAIIVILAAINLILPVPWRYTYGTLDGITRYKYDIVTGSYYELKHGNWEYKCNKSDPGDEYDP